MKYLIFAAIVFFAVTWATTGWAQCPAGARQCPVQRAPAVQRHTHVQRLHRRRVRHWRIFTRRSRGFKRALWGG